MAEIELKGMDEIFAKLEKMGKEANKITNTALAKAGEYEAAEMEKEAPVSKKARSRGMAKSIQVSNVKTKKGIKFVQVSPDKEHFYYKFVELGTQNMPANPFMARTFAKTKEHLKEIIKNELKKGLNL